MRISIAASVSQSIIIPQVDAIDENGWTAAMRACQTGDETGLARAISSGANVNQISIHGSTALMFACEYGQDIRVTCNT
jgi:ankyrin repeat protein